MVSKREKRKWEKYLRQQAKLLDLDLTALMIKELKEDWKMRKRAWKLAKKRKPHYIR